MFTDIKEYILKTRDERRSHLKLELPCIEIGGNSSTCRSHLAHHLFTTIPSGLKVVLCHACNNPKCSNINHLYWGTAKDNYADYVAHHGYSTYQADILKNGIEEVRKRTLARTSAAGKKGGGHNKFNEEELEKIKQVFMTVPKGRGRISKLSKLLNVSHTQINRYIKIYNVE